MNKLFLVILGLVLLSACSGDNTANNTVKNTANNSAPANTAINTSKVDSGENIAELKAYNDKSMEMEDRIKTIEEYVKTIEAKLPKEGTEGTGDNLKRKETDISKETIKDLTDEKWANLHTYSDGNKVIRLKVYSAEGKKKTEEFYFLDDKPVYAFIENDGMGKKGDSSEAKGDKFYFGSEGLFAYIKADGSKIDPTSEEFKKYNDKLTKEAGALRTIAK